MKAKKAVTKRARGLDVKRALASLNKKVEAGRKTKPERRTVPTTHELTNPQDQRAFVVESRWTHGDGGVAGAARSEINITTEIDPAALYRDNQRLGEQLKQLRTENADITKRFVQLLRDAANQGRVLAAYREEAATRFEQTGTGELRLAT
jgi:hypothetical protein